MIGSRAVPALKLGGNACRSLISSQLKRSSCLRQPVRWSGDDAHIHYRKFGEEPKKNARRADFLGAVMWWWILWHFFTEYEEYFGPFFPDPSKWTDEELGVPPL